MENEELNSLKQLIDEQDKDVLEHLEDTFQGKDSKDSTYKKRGKEMYKRNNRISKLNDEKRKK